MRVGFLGPAGTYSEEAVLAGAGAAGSSASRSRASTTPWPPCASATSSARSCRSRTRSRAPSTPRSTRSLARESGVQITGELVHPIHHCLIARAAVPLERIAAVASHPQASGQCATFIRTRLPGAAVLPVASTADAVRLVAERTDGDGAPWAAIGSRAAAEVYGCAVLESGVEDPPGSETRFVWIAREPPDPATGGAWKTALMFWEPSDDRPGWLVRCLAEFADREVNLTRIESRPRREGLGSYMFFVDLDGRAGDPAVAEAIAALRAHAEAVRVLGSFPTAP